jgi:DeoR/GlpR family transcriptional regulator of sugar metabolism
MRKTTDRDEALLLLLRLETRVSVDEIARSLGVGLATVRRDLRRLSAEGRIVRTYGGAAASGPPQADPSTIEALAEKRAIADAAAALVHDGQTIVISSGTTTLEFTRRLVGRRGLTVITNALDAALALLDQEGIELIVLGGAVRPRMHSLLGHLTDLASEELRADMLFMGIPAISLEHGLLSDHMPEILTDRAVAKIARRVVVLADASKFDQLAPAFVFGLDVVDTIVTDARVRPETVDALERAGVEVIVAAPTPVPVPGTTMVSDANPLRQRPRSRPAPRRSTGRQLDRIVTEHPEAHDLVLDR